jgi:Protein of unknown function (DUF3429)
MSTSSARGSLGGGAELAAYLGVAPFAVFPVAVTLLPSYEMRLLAQQAAVAYGAVVLASLGAVHWGLALAGRLTCSPLRIAGAASPGLCAAASVLLGGQRGLALLVVGLGLFWLYEHRAVGEELPEEYLRLRRTLTLVGCSLLALTMILSDSAGLA